MTQNELKTISLDTLQIIKNHKYYVNGKIIDIGNDLMDSIKNTEVYLDNTSYFNHISQMRISPYMFNSTPNYKVLNMSTTDCIELMNSQNLNDIVVLNFASATKAGGGWLNGRVAQEEDITRKSTLFMSIGPQNDFYNYHTEDFPLYSHSMIYSPNILLMKNNKFENIEPIKFACITCAAVNKRDIENTNRWNSTFASQNGQDFIDSLMFNRINYILRLAALKGHKNIVLGAFGCGVFKNNPHIIAEMFRDNLSFNDMEKYFDNVYFAVLDNTPNQENFKAFDTVF